MHAREPLARNFTLWSGCHIRRFGGQAHQDKYAAGKYLSGTKIQVTIPNICMNVSKCVYVVSVNGSHIYLIRRLVDLYLTTLSRRSIWAHPVASSSLVRPHHLSISVRPMKFSFDVCRRLSGVCASVQDWLKSSMSFKRNLATLQNIPYLFQNNPSKHNSKLQNEDVTWSPHIICPPQEPTSVGGHCHYKK